MSKSEKCTCKETYYVDYPSDDGFIERYTRIEENQQLFHSKFFFPSPKLCKQLTDLESAIIRVYDHASDDYSNILTLKSNVREDVNKMLAPKIPFNIKFQRIEDEILLNQLAMNDLIILLLRIKIFINDEQEKGNFVFPIYATKSPVNDPQRVILYLLREFDHYSYGLVEKLGERPNAHIKPFPENIKLVEYYKHLREIQKGWKIHD